MKNLAERKGDLASPPNKKMFDLPAYILGIRPDLAPLFPASDPRQRERFIHWLLSAGHLEYAAVYDDEGFMREAAAKGYGQQGRLTQLQQWIWSIRKDVRKVFRLPAQLNEFRQWFYTYGLEEHRYWKLLSNEEQQAALALPEPWCSRLKAGLVQEMKAPAPRIPFNSRPFGVNVIGYAFGQLGIGEDARMAARALLAARVPMTMLDFPPGKDVPQNDRSMDRHVQKQADYSINLFCMTAEEMGRFYAERGAAQFRDRYNIGYWPWELNKWPKAWEVQLDLVDEVWVSSQHTFDALKPVCNKPLKLMTMAVELGQIAHFSSSSRYKTKPGLPSQAARAFARQHFGLPSKARLFCFAFDLNSWVSRKNPQACVDAFLQAFPARKFSDQQVGLVIKAHKPPQQNKAWEKLKKLAAADSRIHIIESTLPRPNLLALYQACDCFLSLHRAEGFGRGMAEALQLGLHVICTGYSGNVDFCQPPYADLVQYRLVKVGKSEYSHAAGKLWAEPDITHAAKLMRQYASKPKRRTKKQWPLFSADKVGERYKARLKQIQKAVDPSSIVWTSKG